MDNSLFLNIRLPQKPYERIPVRNIQLTSKVCDLKVHASSLLSVEHEKIEFIHNGTILEDAKTLIDEKINNGSTIHVFQKKLDTKKPPVVANNEIIRAVEAFQRFLAVEENYFKNFSPEDIKKILDEYPDFYTDLGAFAILKDMIFLDKLRNNNFAQKCAEHYPTIIRAAEFIAKLKSEAIHKTPSEPDSDWSSSSPSEGESQSEGETATSPQQLPRNTPFINRHQLSEALHFAQETVARPREEVSPSTATIVTENSTPSTPATPSTSQPPVTLPTQQSQSRQPNQFQWLVELHTQLEQRRLQYAVQLQTMHELGFLNEEANLEALLFCEGNVETAVNFIVSNNENL